MELPRGTRDSRKSSVSIDTILDRFCLFPLDWFQDWPNDSHGRSGELMTIAAAACRSSLGPD